MCNTQMNVTDPQRHGNTTDDMNYSDALHASTSPECTRRQSPSLSQQLLVDVLRQPAFYDPLKQQKSLPPQFLEPARPGTILSGTTNTGSHDTAQRSSNNVNNSKVDCSRMGMKEWIVSALHSLGPDMNHSQKLSCSAYLTSAMKIAHSLASQEVKGANVMNFELPAREWRWSDQVSIYMKNSDHDGKENSESNAFDGNLDKLDAMDQQMNGRVRHCGVNGLSDDNVVPYAPGKPPSSDPKELQDMLTLIIPDISLLLDDEDQTDGSVQKESERDDDLPVGSLDGIFSENEDLQDNGGSTFKPIKPFIKRLLKHKDIQQGGNDEDRGKTAASGLDPNSIDPGVQFLGRESLVKSKDFQDITSCSVPNTLSDNENQLRSQGKKDRMKSGGTAYLNIASAELHMGNNAHKSQLEDRRMRIHFLGIVFFELFSGGNRPTELGIDPLDHLEGHDESGLSSAGPSNLAAAKNIIDAIGEDDELFGSNICDDSVDIKSTKNSSQSGSNNDIEETPHKISRASSSSSSAEPLKSFGLPIALCDLIGNMINCSRGDFGDDETYDIMTDVQNDLALMLESPGAYLHDLDLDLACDVGLQVDNGNSKLFGRDTEIAQLKQIYLRSISNQCEVAIICGAGGIGKTKLTHDFLQYAISGDEGEANRQNGCIFLSGKFDRLQQSQPLSAVASAFNEYCDWLSNDENVSIATKVSSVLKETLGMEVFAVAKLIPNLSKIIGVSEIDLSTSCVDAQKRLRYILCQFIEVISSAHDAPLILFLDDCQWADSASVALVNQVLLVSQRFFFLGCCRDDEMGKDHRLWNMLDAASAFGVNATKIELNCLDRETVNSMISEKLKLLPRLTRPLAEIVHHKTKGNPFFVGQLMIELNKEGLLRPSLSQHRWVWEEHKIQERELPNDVIVFMTTSLNRLPSQVLFALCTLSCFGASSDCSLVEKLEREIESSLSGPLNSAIAEGFLLKKDEKYFFVHDRVQEAVYNSMKPDERCLYHFKYGSALCSTAMRDKDDCLYLIAVTQINLGGPKAVPDGEKSLTVANLNLAAGKTAMAMADFFSAYWFFDNGISYLKKGNWKDHYDLSMALYNGAAQCALPIGEHSSLNILSEQVLRYAKCFEDKLDMLLTTMTHLQYVSKFPKVIELGTSALSNLGEELPKPINSDVIKSYTDRTNSMLGGMVDEDFFNHNLMKDKKKIMVMKYLAKLYESTNMVRPSDQPVIVMKMVQLSLVHGMSPISPLAFVYFGSFLACMGNIREGYRFAKIGKALTDKIGFRQQFVGQVMLHSTQLMAYVEPVQSVTDFHREASIVAMTSGSTNASILNTGMLASLFFWSGRKLSSVMSLYEECCRLAKQHQHLQIFALALPPYRSVSAMIGAQSNAHSSSVSDPAFDSVFDACKVEQVGKNFTFFSKQLHFHKIYVAFMFRKFETCRGLAESQYHSLKLDGYYFFYISSIQTFYQGLISLWIWREENDEKWVEKAKECTSAMKKLVESASRWNFQNKLYLLQAEEKFCERNFELAEFFYDAAILSAKEHRFLNEEALALELAGIFYLETGRKKRSIPYLSQAAQKYREWEAWGKASSVETYMDDA